MDPPVMTLQKLVSSLTTLAEVDELWGVVVSFRCPFRAEGNRVMSMSVRVVDASVANGTTVAIVSQLLDREDAAMPVRAVGDVVCFRNLKISRSQRSRNDVYLDFKASTSSAYLFAGETDHEKEILYQQPHFQDTSQLLTESTRDYLRLLRNINDHLITTHKSATLLGLEELVLS
mmetsp:Transcript_1599/g.4805  ORF Transcript_1599/g.4805 Transcript_1599/m.4805 type:complete len:175 (+) Transcript_1599:113-637(+)